MDSSLSLDRLFIAHDGEPHKNEDISDELRAAIDKTRAKIRQAFADGAKGKAAASLKGDQRKGKLAARSRTD
jgi:hypothetical protein